MSERRAILRGRLRRPGHEGSGGADEVVEIDPGELSGLFAAPQWLRDLGFSAWLLVGAGAALIGAIWLLSLTETIVLPVIVAGIIASVASPSSTGFAGAGSRGGLAPGSSFSRSSQLASASG